jgi:hypothetical protein
MSALIGRRELLSFLPALALPFGIPKPAFGSELNDSPLLINAADSLYHYRTTLLEKVRGDAYYESAQSTERAVEACNTTLSDLRDAVSKLRLHVDRHANWPALQQRFSTLEQSLALAQGKHSDQENAEALRSIPQTIDALRSLMKEISSACNDDPDGQVADLVDRVYRQINGQNRAVENVDAHKSKWNEWINEIAEFHQRCGSSMDKAAIAVTEGVNNKAGWQDRALSALKAAGEALNGIEAVDKKMAEDAPSTGRIRFEQDVTPQGITAIKTLRMMLDATQTSLNPTVRITAIQVAYRTGKAQASQSQVPSLSLSKTDAGLIHEVQALVRQPRYFTPGSTTQTVNCIAVCWPVWVVYSTNNPVDVQQRTS